MTPADVCCSRGIGMDGFRLTGLGSRAKGLWAEGFISLGLQKPRVMSLRVDLGFQA